MTFLESCHFGIISTIEVWIIKMDGSDLFNTRWNALYELNGLKMLLNKYIDFVDSLYENSSFYSFYIKIRVYSYFLSTLTLIFGINGPSHCKSYRLQKRMQNFKTIVFVLCTYRGLWTYLGSISTQCWPGPLCPPRVIWLS